MSGDDWAWIVAAVTFVALLFVILGLATSRDGLKRQLRGANCDYESQTKELIAALQRANQAESRCNKLRIDLDAARYEAASNKEITEVTLRTRLRDQSIAHGVEIHRLREDIEMRNTMVAALLLRLRHYGNSVIFTPKEIRRAAKRPVMFEVSGLDDTVMLTLGKKGVTTGEDIQGVL